MMTVYALAGVAVLLALAPIALAFAASARATDAVYGVALVTTSALCVIAMASLFERPAVVSTAVLPVGLPWLGAHFGNPAGPFPGGGPFSATAGTRSRRSAFCRFTPLISPP